MAIINRDDFMDDVFGDLDRVVSNMRNMFTFLPDPFFMMNNMLSPCMSRMRFMRPDSDIHSLMMNAMPSSSSYSFSSSVMNMGVDRFGRPQIYEATSSSRCGPDGVKETTSTIRDTVSGLQRMSIGHHLNDRAHIMQRFRNAYTGEEEEQDDYINLDEEESEKFEGEWKTKMAASHGYRLPYNTSISRNPHCASEILALPAPAESNNASQNHLLHERKPNIAMAKERIQNSGSNERTRNQKAKNKRLNKPYKKSK